MKIDRKTWSMVKFKDGEKEEAEARGNMFPEKTSHRDFLKILIQFLAAQDERRSGLKKMASESEISSRTPIEYNVSGG